LETTQPEEETIIDTSDTYGVGAAFAALMELLCPMAVSVRN